MSKTRVAPPCPPTVYPQGVGPRTELVWHSVGANPSGVRSAAEYMPDAQAINRALASSVTALTQTAKPDPAGDPPSGLKRRQEASSGGKPRQAKALRAPQKA